MSRSAEEIHAANCFHVWRQGWRDGAQRRMVSSVATGHSDPRLAATYRDGYAEGTAAAKAADKAACERYGYAPSPLRAEVGE